MWQEGNALRGVQIRTYALPIPLPASTAAAASRARGRLPEYVLRGGHNAGAVVLQPQAVGAKLWDTVVHRHTMTVIGWRCEWEEG